MPVKSKKNNQARSLAKKKFEDQVELFAMGIQSCSGTLERRNYTRMRKHGGDNEIRLISAKAQLKEHDDSYFDASIAYELVVRDKKEAVDPLKLECTFEAHFHGPKPIVHDDADRFVKTYFKIISWPYFRQFVSDMTARMSIAPLVLPLFPETEDESPQTITSAK